MSMTAPSSKLPPDTFAAIGEVIVHWTHLTAYMDMAIFAMLGVSASKTAWITAALRHPGRKEVLQSCRDNYFKGKGKDDPVLKEFNGILSDIDACYAERNAIDHAIWWHFGTDTSPSMRVRVQPKNISPPEVKLVTPDDIRKTTARIVKAIERFRTFLEKHLPLSPP